MTLFLSYFLTKSLNYFKVDEEELPPAGFDEEELSTVGFDEEELSPCEFDKDASYSALQFLLHFSYTAAQSLLSGLRVIQVSLLFVQLSLHSCRRFSSFSPAIEMPAKEKNNKYEIMPKHEITENILNCFIIRPPSIYRHVS
jgi:hypothetical protein